MQTFQIDESKLPPEIRQFREQARISTERIMKMVCKNQEDWMADNAARFFPYEIHEQVKARENLPAVAEWMEQEGFHVAIFPDGKRQFRKLDEVLSELPPPSFKM